ncbi:hypothetical protein Q31b_53490 [Novipirellula aureliae]|uniref:DinB superfamily protein n=1 Tax=Novipirellula aureliae TaxID=2527966 RepID=A0A5C6DDD9_9BACT|nr:DinB family protein [Novipirellula aureliae]TWU35253.1 hypothetical protein Q31b_53490 [Novipirellula aureliae]
MPTNQSTHSIGQMLTASVHAGLSYAERLTTDVSPEQFARFARIGDTVIESNHAAFNYGHLSLYACRIIETVGGDPTPYLPSAEFTKVFSRDTNCVDDADGTIYPPMDAIVEALVTGYKAVAQALAEAEDDLFRSPNVNEAMRERFPTNGAMLGFYVGGHFMMHMGQTSAWRRAMGLGPV